jgi:hypothetical protein
MEIRHPLGYRAPQRTSGGILCDLALRLLSRCYFGPARSTRSSYSYSQWVALPYPARVAYIAGAYDSLVNFDTPGSGTARYASWAACISRAQMTVGQLTDNVLNFSQNNPTLQTGMVQQALYEYLMVACGLPASK